MIKPYEALKAIIDNIQALQTENVMLYDLLGRVLADKIVSGRNIPVKDSSAMDGYAVNTSDLQSLPATLKVLGTIVAGDDIAGKHVNKGECYKIMTGAYLPDGANAVIEWELTDNGADKVVIKSLSSMGDNIRPAKDDIAEGDVIDFTGKRATPFIISRLASVGALFADVYRKPKVAVISTGSEIAPLSRCADKNKMLDANSSAIMGMLRQEGAECSYLGVVPDDDNALLAALKRTSNYDMVVISGGISTGEFDYMAKIADRAGIDWIFHKIYQKPGKPVAFGKMHGTPIFALPGNPVSCMFCTYFYVIPAVRKMSGMNNSPQSYIMAVLGEDVSRRNGRIQFDRVRLERRDGILYAYPFRSQNSNLISSMTESDAFMELDDFEGTVPKGGQVKVYIFNPEAGI